MELQDYKDELLRIREIGREQKYLSKSYIDIFDKIIKSV